MHGVDLPCLPGQGGIPGALPQLASVPVPCCPASCAICLPWGTPWGARLSASFSREGLGVLQPRLPPACRSRRLAGGLGCASRGSRTSTIPPRCQKGEALLPCPTVTSPALSWRFWHRWPLLRQFNFLKCQKDFFFPLLAGIAFCKFSEQCHPVKGSGHPQSWLGESGASSPAGGDQLWPAPAKAFVRHPRKLTKKWNFFSFFFIEVVQWLICKISL